MSARRIAIVSDWFAPRRGGIEAQLAQLAQRLGARGHAVDVFTSTPGAREGEGYRVRPADVWTLPALHLAASPRLVQRLRRQLDQGYDVVHAHVSVVSPLGYAGAIAARSLGLPTVLTFHSVLHAKAHVLRAASAVLDLPASAIVWTAVSRLVALQAKKAMGVPVLELPNGIELAEWRTLPGARTLETPVTIVSAMRLHRKKRPRQLVAAFARAAKHARRPARLLIVGDGPERSALDHDIRALGLNDGPSRVELHGWVNPNGLRAMYGGAHAFALASRNESFGIAALEARAAGLPVIAMRQSGSSEFLEDGTDALLCDDDADLSRALTEVIRDGALRGCLGQRIPGLERYDWSAVLNGHEAAYQLATTRATAVA
ncbi:MAG: glycosyltransferase [Gemmatimonadaceae bacterium]